MKDPAFLFYPGDFFRDTQCLSEKALAVYLKIMCEHMRNLSITYAQFSFFTKSLPADEAEQLLSVLIKTESGYQIEWVVESIKKRRAFTESRRKNRQGKTKENNTSPKKSPLPYVAHMENEIENEDGYAVDSVIVVDNGKEGMGEKPNLVYPFDTETFRVQWQVWKDYRTAEHKFGYKSHVSEQAALNDLGNLSGYDEANAIAIMHQSIANGWKGFFEIVNHGAKQPSAKGGSGYSDTFKRKIANRLQSG